MGKERRETLLRAACQLIKKSDALWATVRYDDADCDGQCLINDIESELANPDPDGEASANVDDHAAAWGHKTP